MKISLLKTEDKFITILRISLALVFIWFGALKALGYNPVFDMVYGVWPLLASGNGNIALGIAELVIGLLILFNRWHVLVHLVLLVHLAGTFMTFYAVPEIMFDPRFPILTLEGEFVVKNIVLAAAGMVVMIHEHRKHRRS